MKIANKMMTFIAVLLISISLAVFTPAFMTPAYAVTSPTLGNAASFAVLAGTAVTNVPTSVITGDVGLSPAAGSNYAGLTAAEVSGTIFSVNTNGPGADAGYNPVLLTSAKNDLITAYDRLIATDNTSCTTDYGVGPQDLHLVTNLGPGVYCVGAGGFTLNGNLNLTGSSGVWIFRSAATIITSSGSSVTGGDPCNVWWRAETSATLATTTSFIGNILALTSISMNTGATLNGRALARNGAVTLQGNTINNLCTAARAKVVTTPSFTGELSSGPNVCPPFNYIAPIIIESKRIDADSVFISWGPYSGINTFIVQYGLENGKWLYSTKVTGFSTTLNALPANQPFWVEVAATDWCSIGRYGEAKLVGGPGLPNTGFAPRQNTIPWYVPASIFAGISGLLVFIQRKHI